MTVLLSAPLWNKVTLLAQLSVRTSCLPRFSSTYSLPSTKRPLNLGMTDMATAPAHLEPASPPSESACLWSDNFPPSFIFNGKSLGEPKVGT